MSRALALGAAAALAAASLASTRGSASTGLQHPAPEGLDQRIKRMLEEEPPEVSLRAIFLIESIPGAVVSTHSGLPVRRLDGSYSDASSYLGPVALDRLRKEVAQVVAQDQGRPIPDLEDPANWASLEQVVDFLWSWLDEGRWLSGEQWSGGMIAQRGLGGRKRLTPVLTPVAEWVISEVRRIVKELPPARVPFSAISTSRATPNAGRRLVELDLDKTGRLLDYMLDVAAAGVPRVNQGVDFIQERDRWDRFGMGEVFGSREPREIDSVRGVASMRGLGGRKKIVNAVHRPLAIPRHAKSIWSSSLEMPLYAMYRRHDGFADWDAASSSLAERRRRTGLIPESVLIHAHILNLWGALNKHWTRLSSQISFDAQPGQLYGHPWELLPEYDVVDKVALGRVRSQPGQEWSGLRTRHRDWWPTP